MRPETLQYLAEFHLSGDVLTLVQAGAGVFAL